MQQSEGVPRSPYPGPFHIGLLAPRFWGIWLGLGLLWLLTFLPRRLRFALGTWIGDRAYGREKRREIAMTNLAWCFPSWSEAQRAAVCREHFRNMARTVLDYGIPWFAGRRRVLETVSMEGEEYLKPYLDAGRPVILLTCHHAGVDLAGIRYSLSHPALSIFKQSRSPVIDRFLARGRARFGGTVYERTDSLRPVVKLLRRGHALYYIPDEDLGPERSVFAPFFGIPTATLPALGRLAQLGRAVVLPYMGFYNPESGHYTARLFPALKDFPTGDEVEDAARMNAALEMLIRQAPELYMWTLRIFQTRPDGSPPPYRMKGKPGSGPRSAPQTAQPERD